MPDLPSDGARRALSALLVADERESEAAAASVAQFQRRLEMQRRLKHMRALSRGIAESATETLPHDEFRTLTAEGQWVRNTTRGVPTHNIGPDGPQGVQAND
jgi:hypothetical protein